MADETDPRLDEIQDRIDEVRRRVADDPGFAVIDDSEVPAYFRDDDLPEEGVTEEEAARRDDPAHHQGHAPG